MESMVRLGRLFFSLPLVAFGVQYFLYGRFVGGLPPMPQWMPGNRSLAYLTGAALVVAGVSIAAKWKAGRAAAVFGVWFLLCVVVLHGPRAGAIWNDGVIRTRALEPLTMAAAAFVLAETLLTEQADRKWQAAMSPLAFAGRHIFALCMVVFGIQHFLYARFIAMLIPAWLPAHLFWAYFTGCAFIAAGIAISTNMLGRVGATALGVMFLLWVVILHAPRVAHHPRNGDEWSSAIMAVAMCGASWVIAEALRGKVSSSPAPRR